MLDNNWKVVKPLSSTKLISGDKTNYTENGEDVKTEIKTAEVLNSFFSNIVKISRFLSTPQYSSVFRSYYTKNRRSNFKNHGEI